MVFLYITCSSIDEGKRIGAELVRERVAGWVNVSPAQSVYRENGEVKTVDGATIVVKTIESKVQSVEDVVRKLHSHNVPCIASFTLYRLNREYKDWLIGMIA